MGAPTLLHCFFCFCLPKVISLRFGEDAQTSKARMSKALVESSVTTLHTAAVHATVNTAVNATVNATVKSQRMELQAEDADCWCFTDADFDDEDDIEYQSFEECIGLYHEAFSCNEQCEKEEKYVIDTEKGRQSLSICNGRECKCLDMEETMEQSHTRKKVHSFNAIKQKYFEHFNLETCYSMCPQLCYREGFPKAACMWPHGTHRFQNGALRLILNPIVAGAVVLLMGMAC